jgi:nitrogen-specific signal transduction histidine kinase/CheY-like chemotaxis protein
MCKPQVFRGRTVELEGTVQDITDRKRMEQQLRRQERLAAVGQMAAGIAHDFRNRVNAITLHVQMALSDPGLAPGLARKLETVLEESRGIAELIQQILDFSSRAMINVQPLEFGELVDEVMDTVGPQIPSDVQVSVDRGVGEYVVEADGGRIRQALTNLIHNACDAMPEGGELRIALSRVDGTTWRSAASRVFGADSLPGDCACVSVSDTGTGMTEEVRQHLFEPFFTTKDVDSGTGLGLAQVYGIVRQHGGAIDVETELGRGTTVSITLPLHDESEETRGLYPDASPFEEATVLLVERDEALRRAGREVLESLGYRVLTAKNGREALAIGHSPRWSGERLRQVDLIVTELAMPGLNGEELVRKLRKRDPEVKAVAIVHQAMGDDGLTALRETDFTEMIGKPFSVEDLATAVRDSLGDRST